MKCPVCKCDCRPYMEYESIGECPKCGGLFTTKHGDNIDLIRVG